LCLDNREEKINQLAAAAGNEFDVQVEKGLSLLTIRHYNHKLLDNMTTGKNIVLMQQARETVQVLY